MKVKTHQQIKTEVENKESDSKILVDLLDEAHELLECLDEDDLEEFEDCVECMLRTITPLRPQPDPTREE